MPETKQTQQTMTAKQAAAKGYAIVSRASCLAARIDREDWREHLAEGHASGMKWVTALGASAADQYRRCKSRDVIVVPRGWVRLMPNSGSGPTEFVA